jgi:CheY-like chemotaxis protein
MKNILIVDNDLGFIFWLGAALIGAGYQAWPATSRSEAISVASRKPLARLDLLIVNVSLPGASKLIAHFRSTQSQLKVMAVGPQGKTLGGVTPWQPTPGLSEDSAKQEWVRAVKQLSGKRTRAA